MNKKSNETVNTFVKITEKLIHSKTIKVFEFGRSCNPEKRRSTKRYEHVTYLKRQLSISDAMDTEKSLINKYREHRLYYKEAGSSMGNFPDSGLQFIYLSWDGKCSDECCSCVEEDNKRKYETSEEMESGSVVTSFLFGGKKYEVSTWQELLLKVIDCIRRKHKSKIDRVLDIKGSQGLKYFSRKSSYFHNPEKIEGTNIYTETKLDSKHIVKRCYRIIREFGYDNKDLKIRYK